MFKPFITCLLLFAKLLASEPIAYCQYPLLLDNNMRPTVLVTGGDVL
jgi:hypothetical protein